MKRIKTIKTNEDKLVVMQYNKREIEDRGGYRFGVFFIDDIDQNDASLADMEFDTLETAIEWAECYDVDTVEYIETAKETTTVPKVNIVSEIEEVLKSYYSKAEMLEIHISGRRENVLELLTRKGFKRIGLEVAARDAIQNIVIEFFTVNENNEIVEKGKETAARANESGPAAITSEEIKDLILNRGLTVQMVIDEVITLNGYIGVGLISLGDIMQKYCYNKIVHRGDVLN